MDVETAPEKMDIVNGAFCLYELREKPLESRPSFIPYLPGVESVFYPVSFAASTRADERWLQEAVVLRSRLPNVGSAISRLAYCLRTIGDCKKAYPLYEILVNRNTLEEDTWLGAAICASELGKDEEAMRHAEKALVVYPEWRDRANWIIARSANNIAMRLLVKGSDVRRALALAEQAVRLAPDTPAFWDTLASSQAGNGLQSAARNSFEVALLKAKDPASRKAIILNMRKTGMSSTEL